MTCRARGLVLLSTLLSVGGSAGVSAEIAVMASGKLTYIERYHRQDERITLFLEGGGEVTVDASLVANIVPNEWRESVPVTEEVQEVQDLALLPHLDPLIHPAANRQSLDPRLVAAVIWMESSGDPLALSRKGAQGLMQLMPQTARELGVDDVWDPGQNIDGGTRYLRQMLDRYDQDLKKALAAYNAGPTAVTRYDGVPPYAETQRYVRRVLELFREAGGPAEGPAS